MNINRAMEEEMKFMTESKEGSRQYRKGYVRALDVASKLLDFTVDANSAIQQALTVLCLRASVQTEKRCKPKPRQIDQNVPCAMQTESEPTVSPNDTLAGQRFAFQEMNTLRLVLAVLRSNTEDSDFLNSWLLDYGTKILTSNPPPLLPETFFDDQIVIDVTTYIH